MKRTENQIGIYKIVSPSGKVYIGQSRRLKKRFSNYRCLNNCHEQRILFNSFKKHGVENHVFEVIHPCSIDELNDLEKYYIELYQCTNRKTGLNIRHGGLGKIHSPETIEKIRVANQGKKMSEESKRKMSESKKGKSPWNKGLKGSQVAWNKGVSLNEKQKERLRSLAVGRNISDEHKEIISKTHKGKPKSEEHKAKLKSIFSGRIVSDETRAKMRESRLNYINKNK